MLFSAAYSERHLYEEGFSTVRWDNGPSSGGWCAPTGVTPANPTTSTATTCGPAAQGVPRLAGTPANIAAYNAASSADNFHPRLPRYGRLTHDQDRLGMTGAIQIKPADGTLLTLDMMYAKLNATRQEDFLEAISFSRTAGQGGKPQTSVVDTAYAPNGALLYGVYNGVDIRAESRYDKLSTTFTQPVLSLEQDIGESFKLNAKVGRAKSKFDNPVQTTTTLDALNVNGYGIDFRGNDRQPAIIAGRVGATGVGPGAQRDVAGCAEREAEQLHAVVSRQVARQRDIGSPGRCAGPDQHGRRERGFDQLLHGRSSGCQNQ